MSDVVAVGFFAHLGVEDSVGVVGIGAGCLDSIVVGSRTEALEAADRETIVTVLRQFDSLVGVERALVVLMEFIIDTIITAEGNVPAVVTAFVARVDNHGGYVGGQGVEVDERQFSLLKVFRALFEVLLVVVNRAFGCYRPVAGRIRLFANLLCPYIDFLIDIGIHVVFVVPEEVFELGESGFELRHNGFRLEALVVGLCEVDDHLVKFVAVAVGVGRNSFVAGCSLHGLIPCFVVVGADERRVEVIVAADVVFEDFLQTCEVLTHVGNLEVAQESPTIANRGRRVLHTEADVACFFFGHETIDVLGEVFFLARVGECYVGRCHAVKAVNGAAAGVGVGYAVVGKVRGIGNLHDVLDGRGKLVEVNIRVNLGVAYHIWVGLVGCPSGVVACCAVECLYAYRVETRLDDLVVDVLIEIEVLIPELNLRNVNTGHTFTLTVVAADIFSCPVGNVPVAPTTCTTFEAGVLDEVGERHSLVQADAHGCGLHLGDEFEFGVDVFSREGTYGCAVFVVDDILSRTVGIAVRTIGFLVFHHVDVEFPKLSSFLVDFVVSHPLAEAVDFGNVLLVGCVTCCEQVFGSADALHGFHDGFLRGGVRESRANCVVGVEVGLAVIQRGICFGQVDLCSPEFIGLQRVAEVPEFEVIDDDPVIGTVFVTGTDAEAFALFKCAIGSNSVGAFAKTEGYRILNIAHECFH